MTPFVCGICATILDSHDGEPMHIRETDHVPVPIPYVEMPHVILRCDFCANITPESEIWTHGSRPMTQTFGRITISTDDVWGACPDCHADILDRRIVPLADRAVANIASGDPVFARAHISEAHRSFLAHATGEFYKGLPTDMKDQA